MRYLNSLYKRAVCASVKKATLFIVLIFTLQIHNTKGQLAIPQFPTQCVPVGSAADFKCVLDWLRLYGAHDCVNPVEITFRPDATINLGDLHSEELPVIVPVGTVLNGDFAINNIGTDNKSHGTTILFPYLYPFVLIVMVFRMTCLPQLY